MVPPASLSAPSLPTLAALVLAGGRARRMEGADKPLLTLGARPLISYALSALAASGRPLAISANGEAARFAPFGVPVLKDGDDSFPGPLAGVLAGLEWAEAQGATALLTAPADCPFLPADLAQRLTGARSAGGIAHARAGGRDHPAIALWPVSARAALADDLGRGNRRVMGFLHAFGTQAVDWADEAAFLNINTPEDLARAEALLAQRKMIPGKT